jgi:hypothetical protein
MILCSLNTENLNTRVGSDTVWNVYICQWGRSDSESTLVVVIAIYSRQSFEGVPQASESVTRREQDSKFIWNHTASSPGPHSSCPTRPSPQSGMYRLRMFMDPAWVFMDRISTSDTGSSDRPLRKLKLVIGTAPASQNDYVEFFLKFPLICPCRECS